MAGLCVGVVLREKVREGGAGWAWEVKWGWGSSSHTRAFSQAHLPMGEPG